MPVRIGDDVRRWRRPQPPRALRVAAAWGHLPRCASSPMRTGIASSARLAARPTALATRPTPILGRAPIAPARPLSDDATVSEREADRPTRRASPAVVELEALRAAQPDLASAAELQLALLAVERRVQSRVPLPAAPMDASARPLIRFNQIPIEWSDFRMVLREVADILHRHEALDDDDYARAQHLAHEAHDLEPLVAAWYAGPAALAKTTPPPSDMLAQLLLLAIRPFLTKGAEACRASVDLTGWRRGPCPVCSGEPDFATITPAAERLLICGRCASQWPFHDFACPYCDNTDKASITSLASRDGLYRIYGCDRCLRYLKAYDARRGTRPVIVAVDSISTLPLDAAAMQRGYHA